jgi:hypothetical protein
VLRARLIGGQRAKASRGELEMKLPIGLVHDATGKVALDPDLQVQEAVRTFFETFRRTGSATSTVRAYREQGLLFPRRVSSGPHQGELAWGPLLHWRALQALKNPRYAGAFVYGRSQVRRKPDGKEARTLLPREQWHTLIRDAHPGTSPGTNLKRTSADYMTTVRPTVPTGRMDLRAKVQRCCRVWLCAVGVAEG